MRIIKNNSSSEFSQKDEKLTKNKASMIVETSYLAATTSLIWIALYYLPIGGAIFRLALPLPLSLLLMRRGIKTGFEGLSLAVLLLAVLMGPIRGPLILFPYGLLSVWLGFCWYKRFNWWLSWFGGVLIGTIGFLVRVVVLSVLVGENLWVIITRAGSSLMEQIVDLLNIPFVPDMTQVQLVGMSLVVLQEMVFVLSLHALAFWIFPRLQVSMPDPPNLLNGFITLDNL